LRYIVVNELKGKKFKVYDPNKGSQYYLTLHEIKNKALGNKTDWDFAETEDKIVAICSEELKEYKINFDEAITENGHATVFNKLTYFKYLKESFGFKDFEAEKNFLNDLLRNQEISSVPANFKTLELEKGKIKNKAPLILNRQIKRRKRSDSRISSRNQRQFILATFQTIGRLQTALVHLYFCGFIFCNYSSNCRIYESDINR
jgi:subfamily B ATP-binding cassette protein HlyB/CyaB